MNYRKLFLAVVFFAATQFAAAQDVQRPVLHFGTFSYAKVLEAMPEYATVKNDLAELRKKYDAEAKRSEDDFNQKYELFLEGQRDFAPSIMKKRRSELEDMLQRNIEFRKETDRLLRQAETDALAPLKNKVVTILARVGQERDLLFIANTDDCDLPFVNPDFGIDLTDVIIAETKK